MQTRTALRHLSGDDLQWGDGPLAKVAGQLLEAFQVRESDRMERAELAAATMGTGPMFAALQRRFAESEARSLIDIAAPMIMRFDAYQCLRNAAQAAPQDRGLKMAAAHTKELWVREPDGVLAVGDVVRLRAHWAAQFPRSRVAAVIDTDLPKVGFNTLPVAKLAQMATHIRGRDLSELETSYDVVVRTHGLDGDAPHQIRARAYLRGLVHLASEEEPSGTVEAGGEAAGDRALRRMAAFDDPILRAVGQLEPVSQPNDGDEPPVDLAEGAPLGAHEEEVPHQEDEGTIVEVNSPITGEPLALELELTELELTEGAPGAPGEPGEPELEPDVTPEDVDGLQHFGQLDDFMGDDGDGSPLDTGESPMMNEGEGEVTTTIEDPSAPGEMLEVTIAPLGHEEPGAQEGTPEVPLDVPLEGENGHVAHRRRAAPPNAKDPGTWAKAEEAAKQQYGAKGSELPKDRWFAVVNHIYQNMGGEFTHEGGMEENASAPAGWKKTVEHMKDEPKIDNPFALANWMKDQGYHPHPHKQSSFAVYAVSGGYKAEEPLERFSAESMPRAIRHVAQLLGELGAGGTVKADPETFARQALIVLDASTGNHLLVLAEGPEKGSEFYPDVHTQQPAQVSVPSDGSEALASNGGFDQPRATRPIDTSPGASAVSRHAMTKEEVQTFCEQTFGLTRASVEATLLAADPVLLTDANGRVAWKIEIDDEGQVALSRGASVVKTAGLDALESAIDDFLARCAAEASLGGHVVGEGDVAPHFEIQALFQVGCAQCGGIAEYLMPKTAAPVTCGNCGFETPAQAVAVQLHARQGALASYLILTEVPGEQENRELYARRLMAAIQKVVPAAVGTLRDGQLEVQVRQVGDAHLARIRNVLESAFGVRPQTRTAQGGATQQELQTTVPNQIGVGVNTQPTPGPTYKPPATVPPPPIGGPGVAPQTAPMPGAPTGTPSQQQFMEENASITPARAARQGPPLWDLTYRTAEGPMTLQIEAADQTAARRIFAAYDPDTEVLSIRRAQEAPPPAPAGAPPGGPPPAGPEGAPPEAGAGGMGGGMGGGMALQQGATITPQVQEAIRAAMITLRNTGIDPASAVDQFQGQFKQLLQKFGDEHSPGRQQLGAEIIKAVQEAWSKPALIDLTASIGPRLAFVGIEAMLKDAIGKMTTPGKIAPEQNKDKVQLPGTTKILGPDSASKEPAVMNPGRIKTQHGKPQGGTSPTDMGGGEEGHDPGTFGAEKPPADGSYGLVGQGTSTPPTDLGRDSQTGDNETSSHWDSVFSAAGGMPRSLPGGHGAPDTRRKATAGLSSLKESANTDNDALFWLSEAVRRAKATGEFPEDELWAARDAGLEKIATKFSPPVKTIVKDALEAL